MYKCCTRAAPKLCGEWGLGSGQWWEDVLGLSAGFQRGQREMVDPHDASQHHTSNELAGVARAGVALASGSGVRLPWGQ